METFVKICFGIFALLISTLFGGYVFMKLWNWIIVTTFEAQTLTLAQSIGLMLIYGYVKSKPNREDETTFDDIVKSFVETIVLAFWALGIGWIVTLFL